MARTTVVPVMIKETRPDIPGHAGRTETHSAKRRASIGDGRYWLVRRRGLFRRWQWLPVRGAFVSLFELEGKDRAMTHSTRKTGEPNQDALEAAALSEATETPTRWLARNLLAVQKERDTFGVEAVLEPRRRVDWTEPATEEGAWDLPTECKVGED
uniref:hypothetical protein n=1 Tax=Microbacterium proteolyticum TaxID=1572644 RepID=UPI0024169956|nr:hypothetical protein [Microbacterium proteolyticum]